MIYWSFEAPNRNSDWELWKHLFRRSRGETQTTGGHLYISNSYLEASEQYYFSMHTQTHTHSLLKSTG